MNVLAILAWNSSATAEHALKEPRQRGVAGSGIRPSIAPVDRPLRPRAADRPPGVGPRGDTWRRHGRSWSSAGHLAGSVCFHTVALQDEKSPARGLQSLQCSVVSPAQPDGCMPVIGRFLPRLGPPLRGGSFFVSVIIFCMNADRAQGRHADLMMRGMTCRLPAPGRRHRPISWASGACPVARRPSP